MTMLTKKQLVAMTVMTTLQENMTPKQFIRYIKYLNKNNIAICDGMTENVDLWTMLMNILIVGGCLGLIWFGFHTILNIICKEEKKNDNRD